MLREAARRSALMMRQTRIADIDYRHDAMPHCAAAARTSAPLPTCHFPACRRHGCTPVQMSNTELISPLYPRRFFYPDDGRAPTPSMRDSAARRRAMPAFRGQLLQRWLWRVFDGSRQSTIASYFSAALMTLDKRRQFRADDRKPVTSGFCRHACYRAYFGGAIFERAAAREAPMGMSAARMPHEGRASAETPGQAADTTFSTLR